MECGVYRIINLINRKVYVGSSTNLAKREREHFKKLRDGNHHSIHLQRAWDIYGAKAFSFQVIENVPDREVLREKEKHWIDKSRALNRDYGYNVSESTKNFSVSGERHPMFGKNRAELGHKNHWKGRKIPEHIKAKMRKPRSEASKKNMSMSHADVKGDKNPMFGKTFSGEHREKIRNALIGRTLPEEHKEKLRGRKGELSYVSKKVIQYSLDGKVIKEYVNITEAANETGATRQHISKCCSGARNKCGGFKWSYSNNT